MAFLRSHLQRWDFPSLGFSLLPFVLCLTVPRHPSASRTYGPSALVRHLPARVSPSRPGRRALLAGRLPLFAQDPWHRGSALRSDLLADCAGLSSHTLWDLWRNAASPPSCWPRLPSCRTWPIWTASSTTFSTLHFLIGAFALARLGNLLGLAIATATTIVGLLIHEAFALMFYPLILVLAADLVHRRRLSVRWAAATSPWCSELHGHHPFRKAARRSDEWVTAAQQRTDIHVDGTVFLVLSVPFAISSTSSVTSTLRRSSVLSCSRWLYRSLRHCSLEAYPHGMRFRRYSILHSRCLMLVFAAPLVLSLLGHDVMRWVSALCINVSLYLLLVYRSTARVADSPDVPDLHKVAHRMDGYSCICRYFALSAGAGSLGHCRQPPHVKCGLSARTVKRV